MFFIAKKFHSIYKNSSNSNLKRSKLVVSPIDLLLIVIHFFLPHICLEKGQDALFTHLVRSY